MVSASLFWLPFNRFGASCWILLIVMLDNNFLCIIACHWLAILCSVTRILGYCAMNAWWIFCLYITIFVSFSVCM
jgi:hypothetical protein